MFGSVRGACCKAWRGGQGRTEHPGPSSPGPSSPGPSSYGPSSAGPSSPARPPGLRFPAWGARRALHSGPVFAHSSVTPNCGLPRRTPLSELRHFTEAFGNPLHGPPRFWKLLIRCIIAICDSGYLSRAAHHAVVGGEALVA